MYEAEKYEIGCDMATPVIKLETIKTLNQLRNLFYSTTKQIQSKMFLNIIIYRTKWQNDKEAIVI